MPNPDRGSADQEPRSGETPIVKSIEPETSVQSDDEPPSPSAKMRIRPPRPSNGPPRPAFVAKSRAEQPTPGADERGESPRIDPGQGLGWLGVTGGAPEPARRVLPRRHRPEAGEAPQGVREQPAAGSVIQHHGHLAPAEHAAGGGAEEELPQRRVAERPNSRTWRTSLDGSAAIPANISRVWRSTPEATATPITTDIPSSRRPR